MSVTLEGVTKRFGPGLVLKGIDLSVTDGEFMALLGPSGSGKTTLLRIVAGLETPDAGRVVIAGQDVADVPANRRGVGFVFQNYALFRHMTVAQNITFGLSVRPRATRPSRAAMRDRVRELLELIQLPDIADRRPDQLSGGQRQRVALARALAIEPKVLLLDEPFGALDAQVRKDLRRWLRQIHDRLGTTTLFVTHDQKEAMDLADRVALLQAGHLVQVATPRVLHEAPVSAAVFAFLGDWFGLDCRGGGRGGAFRLWRRAAADPLRGRPGGGDDAAGPGPHPAGPGQAAARGGDLRNRCQQAGRGRGGRPHRGTLPAAWRRGAGTGRRLHARAVAGDGVS